MYQNALLRLFGVGVFGYGLGLFAQRMGWIPQHLILLCFVAGFVGFVWSRTVSVYFDKDE